MVSERSGMLSSKGNAYFNSLVEYGPKLAAAIWCDLNTIRQTRRTCG